MLLLQDQGCTFFTVYWGNCEVGVFHNQTSAAFEVDPIGHLARDLSLYPSIESTAAYREVALTRCHDSFGSANVTSAEIQ